MTPTRVLRRLGLAAPLALLLAACGESRQASADNPLADQERRLADLEERIAEITERISPSGRGAYASGPALLVDQQGADSLLQRLHDLRDELAAARSAMQQHAETLAEVRLRLGAAQEENRDLRGEIAILQRHRESLTIAQQELAAARERAIEQRERLIAAQRRRLAMERAYAEFAREILALEPLDTRTLVDLQNRVRADIEALWPPDVPGEDGSGDPASGSLR